MSKSPLFKHLNHIQYSQRRDYFSTLSDKEIKDWNSFMITKFLSMDIHLLEICDYLNKYQGSLSKPEYYKLLINVIPEGNYNLRYLSNKKKGSKEDVKEEIIRTIQDAYDCTFKVAMEYYHILDPEKLKQILLYRGKNPKDYSL